MAPTQSKPETQPRRSGEQAELLQGQTPQQRSQNDSSQNRAPGAQNNQQGNQQAKPQGQNQQDQSRPGPEHEQLAKLVGRWDASVTHWAKEGEAPQSITGKAEIAAQYDGRYFVEKFSGDMGGKKFEGTGITGYDRLAQEYVTIWYDNMSTAIIRMTGRSPDNGRTVDCRGTGICQSEHIPIELRHVVRRESDDRFTVEMYRKANGKERKTMEIEYSRRS